MEDNKAKASILDSLITSIDNNKQIVLYIGRGKNGSACELNYDPEQLFILTLDKEIKCNIICFSNKQFGKLLNDSFNDEVLKKIEGYEIFSKQIVHLNEQYPHWISGQVDCFYQFIC